MGVGHNEGAGKMPALRLLARAGHGHVRDRLRWTHLAPKTDTVVVAHLVEAQTRQCCKALRIASREVVDGNRPVAVEEHNFRIEHARELIDVLSLREVWDEWRLGADNGIRRNVSNEPPRDRRVMINIESLQIRRE